MTGWHGPRWRGHAHLWVFPATRPDRAAQTVAGGVSLQYRRPPPAVQVVGRALRKSERTPQSKPERTMRSEPTSASSPRERSESSLPVRVWTPEGSSYGYGARRANSRATCPCYGTARFSYGPAIGESASSSPPPARLTQNCIIHTMRPWLGAGMAPACHEWLRRSRQDGMRCPMPGVGRNGGGIEKVVYCPPRK